jgi:hypothetical protein
MESHDPYKETKQMNTQSYIEAIQAYRDVYPNVRIPEISLLSAVFSNGLTEAAKDLIKKRVGLLSRPSTPELEWVFNNTTDNRILSFNWYCQMFGKDPETIRSRVVNMSFEQEFKQKVQKGKGVYKHKKKFTKEYCIQELLKVPDIFVAKDLLRTNSLRCLNSFKEHELIRPTGIKFKTAIQYEKVPQ